jgi:hypothetical protein
MKHWKPDVALTFILSLIKFGQEVKDLCGVRWQTLIETQLKNVSKCEININHRPCRRAFCKNGHPVRSINRLACYLLSHWDRNCWLTSSPGLPAECTPIYTIMSSTMFRRQIPSEYKNKINQVSEARNFEGWPYYYWRKQENEYGNVKL